MRFAAVERSRACTASGYVRGHYAVIATIALLGLVLTVSAADRDDSNRTPQVLDGRKILNDASVFAILNEPREEREIEELAAMGVDVVVRGMSTAWRATPAEARQRIEAKRNLTKLARERGMVFSTMITSSAIYEEKVPNGSIDYNDWCARDAHGNPIPVVAWRQGCLNAPGFRQYIKEIARAVIDGGADGIHYDEAYSRWFFPTDRTAIPCFCDHCERELAQWLKANVSPAELRMRYSIDNVDTFRYRQYLAEHGYTSNPEESPLHDAWWLMQLETTHRYEKEIVADAKKYGREKYGKDIITNSNAFMVATKSAVMTLETDVYDFVNIGTTLQLPFRRDGRWGREVFSPHALSLVPQYKMAQAHANGKPVVLFLDIYMRPPEFLTALTQENQERYFHWLLAEAYACGSFFALHHTFRNFFGPIRAQTKFARFFKKHRRYAVDSLAVADVGVIYSYPSQIWEAYGYFDRGRRDPIHTLQYQGVCQALQEENVQYETLFFGDGKLFPETPADSLARYDILILPGAFSLLDQQIRWLERYIERGGKLIIVPPVALVDQRNQRRAGAWPPGELPVVIVNQDFEATLSKKDPEAVQALIDSLHLAGLSRVLTVEENVRKRVQVHARLTADKSAFVVHVIGTSFEPGRGYTLGRIFNLNVSLPDHFDANKVNVRILSSDDVAPLDSPGEYQVIGSHNLSITVPAYVVHQMIVVE